MKSSAWKDGVDQSICSNAEQRRCSRYIFDTQTEVIGSLKDFKNTGKTVAYFFVNTDGTVIVRSSSDYIPKMIDIAGGKYIFQDLKNTKSKSASVELSMEEFYAKAKNADYLIYNASIDSPINSIADLNSERVNCSQILRQ